MQESVIIVDDHAGVRDLMVQTLALNGFSATAYASAEAAQVGADWPSVVLALVDWMMPGTPGTDLVLWIAANHPHVQAVVITAAREALLTNVPDITDHATILDKIDITPDRLRALIA